MIQRLHILELRAQGTGVWDTCQTALQATGLDFLLSYCCHHSSLTDRECQRKLRLEKHPEYTHSLTTCAKKQISESKETKP